MQYPLISEYVDAIRNAEDNLDELSSLRPVMDNHGEPQRSSGAFAVVFKMQDKSTEKYYALKCFTEEQERRTEAYQMIADELEGIESSYLTTVKYYDKELFVDSEGCDETEFPVLLMDWVDGETMENYIAIHYKDNHAMQWLCYRFCQMASWLRSQPIAHGDLKPDNIMVHNDGKLTLIDYDGMFVPAMKGQKSPTMGTEDFRHPYRTVEYFDETIDDFALASIALSLKAISIDPCLFERYGASDRLLFSVDDYHDLSKSQVLQALLNLTTDSDFTRLLSLFLLCFAENNLVQISFQLFRDAMPQIIETKATEEDWNEAWTDEYGVKYSEDEKKVLDGGELRVDYRIRKGVEIICNYAFWGAASLRFIHIPFSVMSIGKRAFYGCKSLQSINIPSSVTSIGDEAFYGCKSLQSINIPFSVTSIGGNPFVGCKIKVSCSSSSFRMYEENLYTSDMKKLISCLTNPKNFIIPSSVTSIGKHAFCDCKSLQSIDIPSSVKSISNFAFLECNSLQTINIPSTVTSIGIDVFLSCNSLQSIYISHATYERLKYRLKDYSSKICFTD